jgi:hypothetical protein
MNLYLGKKADVEGFMIKNYKKYGIKDVDESADPETRSVFIDIETEGGVSVTDADGVTTLFKPE